MDVAAGCAPREITPFDRAQFLLDYIDMLQKERLHEAAGFRHIAPGAEDARAAAAARSHDRWVINKLRALNSWYTKGLAGVEQAS
jgi:hypothetical protein